MDSEPKRLYVVEPDSRVSVLLSIKLSAQGYDVTLFDNGAKALKAIETHPPHFILSELLIPECSGLELLRAVRTRYTEKELPFFFLSTLSLEDDVVKGLEAGANDFLAKPFSILELLSRIKKWI